MRALLASRRITVPEGAASDGPAAETVHGLGARKNGLFLTRLAKGGVEVDREAVRLVRAFRARGTPVGVASSSRNTRAVLEAAGLGELFQARVDGELSERLGLRGKPAPDIFLECVRRLGLADASRCMVVEDAESGVEAGRAGGFGLVVAVDREGGRERALRSRGADLILSGFGGMTPEYLNEQLERYRAVGRA